MDPITNDLPSPSTQPLVSADINAPVASPVDAFNAKLEGGSSLDIPHASTSTVNDKNENTIAGTDNSNQNKSMNAYTPSVAADVDLIEKEWVLRAKAIILKTKDDPYEQSSAINRYKADYIKKRYNKDVKVSDK